jgi:hypothetical protein
MNRREILKALATVPLVNALASCREDREATQSPPPKSKTHTLQILFEGPFALVLHKNNPNRLVAFVPRPDQQQRDFAHDFFFNEPYAPKPPMEKDPAGYHFQLSNEGLRTYAETYINPGFADFNAQTEKWRLSDRIVTVELPFPNSINFSGRPLHVKFVSGRTGLMPTNHILEYYLDSAERVKLICSQLEGKCPASPNCPPGVLRFFFGVAPRYKQDAQKHAVEFFNFMLHKCFPDLEEQYKLSYIEPSEEKRGTTSAAMPRLLPAVMDSAVPNARLLRASSVLDCQFAGLIVRTNTGPTG